MLCQRTSQSNRDRRPERQQKAAVEICWDHERAGRHQRAGDDQDLCRAQVRGASRSRPSSRVSDVELDRRPAAITTTDDPKRCK